MAKYNKVIYAAITAVLTAGIAAFVPGINEAWGLVATAVLTVVATYFAPANEQDVPGLESD